MRFGAWAIFEWLDDPLTWEEPSVIVKRRLPLVVVHKIQYKDSLSKIEIEKKFEQKVNPKFESINHGF